MKEYIERGAVIEAIKNHKCKSKVVYSIEEALSCVGQEIGEAIRSVPAAEVVEVVRCKDCKYYAAMITDTVSGDMETAPWGICTQPWFNSDEYDVQENGYCSYGAKRDKEE